MHGFSDGGVVAGPIFGTIISALEFFGLQLANSPPFSPSRPVITGSNEITRRRRALENKQQLRIMMAIEDLRQRKWD